jgi:oligopeptide transport system permease protein
MAATAATESSSVVNLRTIEKSRSPWMDAFRRLIRNRAAVMGAFIILLNVVVAIGAKYIAPHHYSYVDFDALRTAPSWIVDIFPQMSAADVDENGAPIRDATGALQGGNIVVNDNYLLGTDGIGHDLFSQILYGTQVSLLVATVGPLVALLVGTTFGMVAGYTGGRVDNLMMRLVDIMYAFPTLLLVILMMVFFRTSFNQGEEGTIAFRLNKLDTQTGGMFFIFIGIGLTSWMDTARLARGQVLSVRQKEYIEAASSIGASNSAIIFRHVLPNILGPIVVAESLAIPRYISFEAFLSFIGLGVQAPRPSWGSLIAEGSGLISSFPNRAIFPALALFLIMFAFNFLGDGLRDALDPRSSKEV